MTVTMQHPRAAQAWTEIDWRPHERDIAVDGTNIHFVDYGSGPPILLMHGLGCCWEWWLEVLPTLGQSRRVIAIDLPGFGRSDQLPAPAEMATHAELISGLCDALGLERATIGGHSMGGLVCLAMAQRDPERVARVILVNAGGVPMTETRLTIVVGFIRGMFVMMHRPGMLRAMARRPRLRRMISKIAVGGPDALSPALASLVVPYMATAGFVDAVVAAARAVRDTDPEGVHCPVLLLWGDLDPIVPVHTARAMAERLDHPTLITVPGSGHAPMVQDPPAVEQAILEFTEPEVGR